MTAIDVVNRLIDAAIATVWSRTMVCTRSSRRSAAARAPDCSTPVHDGCRMTAPHFANIKSKFIDEFHRRVEAGRRRILGVAPTGSGKTVIFARHHPDQRPALKSGAGARASPRDHRANISRRFPISSIPHGIIMAGTKPRPLELVQVAAIQTLHRRAVHSDVMELPPADLLVIDEAHHCPAETYRKIIDAYPNAVLLGLTATPCRGDGRGLGGIFETIIECPQVAPLIEQGYLVRTKCYAPAIPDLRGVRTIAGDYHEGELADAMDKARLVGDIVTHWHKFSERRKTVAFAVSVAHSVHLRDEFINSGVRAEHIDANTPKPERDATLSAPGVR